MYKKYLMSAFTALALACVTISCNNDEDVYDPTASEAKAKYEAAFKAKFGEPAADHAWGFGQVVSGAKTRAFDSNKNQWGDNYFVAEPLTSEQIEKVTTWFENNKNPEGVAINYSNFFFQNVSASEYGKGMDYYVCGNNDDHLENMNAGTQDFCDNIHYGYDDNIGEDINNRKIVGGDSIGLMVNTSTERFGYMNSNDSKMYYDYVVIPGENIDASLQGRYFVGMDYHQENNTAIAYDGYYNDWIVCITPAFTKGHMRVIAEDLSVEEGGDFDFNDVVFDVRFKDNDNIIITLIAAGGTLPIYIGDTEVHEAFGVPTNVMVNTAGVTREYVEFEMECKNHNWDPNSVPVKVIKESNEVVLGAVRGSVPGKICVKPYYQWCNERQSIEVKYPLFNDYVKDQNVQWY